MREPMLLKSIARRLIDSYQSTRAPLFLRVVAGRLMPPFWGRSRFRSVYIVTYGRTGSTLLNRYLNELPGFKIKGENGLFIETMMECERRLEFATRHKYRRDSPTHPWYGAASIRVDRWRRDIYTAMINQLYPRSPIPKTIGFKEIRWPDVDPEQFEKLLDWTRRLRSPGAVVFLFRRHEDVMKSAWWASQSDAEQQHSRQRLREFESRCLRYSAVNPNSTVVVRYEEFVSDPASPQEICKMLGVSFREAVWRRVLWKQLLHLKQ